MTRFNVASDRHAFKVLDRQTGKPVSRHTFQWEADAAAERFNADHAAALPPATPAAAEAAGYVWSSSFGNPGCDNYCEAWRHGDGRQAWFTWKTPTAPCVASTAL